MAERDRAQRTSVSSQIEQFRQAGQPIEPPADLTPTQRTYFLQTISDREASSWSANHLSIAANLAKTMASMDELWARLAQEGYTVRNDRGTVVANPVVSVLNMMAQQMQALQRTLGLSASQRGLSGAKQGARNQADSNIRELNDAADDHALLA